MKLDLADSELVFELNERVFCPSLLRARICHLQLKTGILALSLSPISLSTRFLQSNLGCLLIAIIVDRLQLVISISKLLLCLLQLLANFLELSVNRVLVPVESSFHSLVRHMNPSYYNTILRSHANLLFTFAVC